MKRVIAYVDGFNLYFGLRSRGWRRFYWLDVQKLALNLLRPDQILVKTKYFTSRISRPPDKVRRQSTFIEALETLKDFEIFYGHYQAGLRHCPQLPGTTCPVPSEKMTDVNIAVELLADAFQDRFDTAILVSGDSDLAPPINKIKSLYPEKAVVAAFPPDRVSQRLIVTASGWLQVTEAALRKSVFPDVVVKAPGIMLRRPLRWK